MGRRASVNRLEEARRRFCGMGTRRAKLLLNKMARVSVTARALRIALEIEDASTRGKKYGFSKWGYRSYEQKGALIRDLVEICEREGWRYGKHRNRDCGPSHIIYFHLPNCEQISFHCDVDESVPFYDGKWDEKLNSTLDKLEVAVRACLNSTEHNTRYEVEEI